MKKHVLFAVLFFAAILFSANVKAQYCGNSGPGICTANQSYNTVGFSPPYDSLPCVNIGVPYSQVIQFHTPPTVTQGGSTYTLNYITIDTVSNLPCGICWASGDANNRINGNATGCMRVSGISFDAPGQYKVHVIVDANVQTIIGSITVSNQNADQLGVKYYARVVAPGGNCPKVDTLAAGNQATTPGSISAPTITGASSLCAGASTQLTATGSGYYAYTWSTGANTSSINVSAAGTYTVTVYGNCASATATKTITQNSAPSASISPASVSVCPGGSTGLTASGGNSYSWSTSSTSATINVSPATPTTYTVTVTGANGCSATVSRQVGIYAPPAAAISPATVSICSGSSTVLTASGGASYLWSNGATTAKDTVSPASTASYTVTVTDVNTCTAATSRTVTIGAVTPHISANGPTSLCSGGTVTLTVDSAFTAYSWSTGETTQSIVVSQSGNYVATVTAGTCQGVSNTIPVIVSSNNLSPTIIANPALNICPGATTTLDAGQGFTSYLWSNNATSQSISVNTAGTYTVTVTQGVCAGSTQATVNVGNYPVSVSIFPAGPVTACAGANVTLNAGAGYASYSWSNNATSQNIQPVADGDYIVTVTKNFCTGTDTVHVTFTPLPQAVISPANPVNACAGDSVSLDAGAGFATYLWSNGSTTQTIQPNATGTYNVSVTQNGCTGVSDTVHVQFNTVPAPLISPSGTVNVCTGGLATLDAGSGYSSYLWTGGETTQTITVNTAGNYSVTVTQNGCTGVSQASTSVAVNSSPVARIDTVIYQGNGINLLIASNAGVTGYEWFYNGSSQGNNSDTLAINCVAGGLYSVAVTNAGGCKDTSATTAVTVCEGISDIKALNSFSIQPVPANDYVSVSYELNEPVSVKMSVIDLTGRNVIDVLNGTESKGHHTRYITLQELPAGVYLLNFMTDTGSFNTKFIKQ